MSGTALAVLLTLAASLVPLALLAHGDPKRLRAIGADAVRPHGAPLRQALTALVLLPGFALMVLGHWPAFLIWLGGLIALGWSIVQLFAARR